MSSPRDENGLNVNEAKFVAAYLELGNGTQAVLSVWPDKANLTAETYARRMFKRPHVRAAVRKFQEHSLKAAQVTNDRIVARLAELAFSRMSAFVGADAAGNLAPRDARAIPIEQIDAIKSVKTLRTTTRIMEGIGGEDMREVEERVIELTLHDSLGALGKLMEYRGMRLGKQQLDEIKRVAQEAVDSARFGHRPELRIEG